VTIRHYVDFGLLGTREEREAFETSLLHRWHSLLERGWCVDPMACDITEDAWNLSFRFWRRVRVCESDS
jgi:hypothetical protein